MEHFSLEPCVTGSAACLLVLKRFHDLGHITCACQASQSYYWLRFLLETKRFRNVGSDLLIISTCWMWVLLHIRNCSMRGNWFSFISLIDSRAFPISLFFSERVIISFTYFSICQFTWKESYFLFFVVFFSIEASMFLYSFIFAFILPCLFSYSLFRSSSFPFCYIIFIHLLSGNYFGWPLTLKSLFNISFILWQFVLFIHIFLPFYLLLLIMIIFFFFF